jgi:hypothetical protein
VKDGESAAFQMQAEAQSDAVERLVEVFQGDAWSGGHSPASDLIDMYRVTCNARSCPLLDVDEAAISEVRDVIADLTDNGRRCPSVACSNSVLHVRPVQPDPVAEQSMLINRLCRFARRSGIMRG